MRQPVDHDVIGGSRQQAHDAEARRPACREQRDVRKTGEDLKAFFEVP